MIMSAERWAKMIMTDDDLQTVICEYAGCDYCECCGHDKPHIVHDDCFGICDAAPKPRTNGKPAFGSPRRPRCIKYEEEEKDVSSQS